MIRMYLALLAHMHIAYRLSCELGDILVIYVKCSVPWALFLGSETQNMAPLRKLSWFSPVSTEPTCHT